MIERFLNTARGADKAIAVCNDTEVMTCAELVGQVGLLRELFRVKNRNPLVVLCTLPSGAFFTAVQLAALAEGVVVPVPAATTTREDRGFMKLIRPDLLSRCRQNLSAPKAPQVIQIQSALPRTPSGKLDRQVIGKAVCNA